MSIFGFGKKDKAPFRAPREVTALRNRIDGELRENFPNPGRYQELEQEAEAVYRILRLAAKEHAGESNKLREDLKNRLAQLAAKIETNRSNPVHEDKDDYLDSNIDYLKRKSLRNSAKSLFTEFLDDIETIKRFCLGEHIEHGRTLDSLTEDLCGIVRRLNNEYLQPHRSDREIGALERDLLDKLAELHRFFQENTDVIKRNGMETATVIASTKLLGIAKELGAR